MLRHSVCAVGCRKVRCDVQQQQQCEGGARVSEWQQLTRVNTSRPTNEIQHSNTTLEYKIKITIENEKQKLQSTGQKNINQDGLLVFFLIGMAFCRFY